MIEVGATALKQVATISKGIPNVYLESELVELDRLTDLRLATNAALDDLVLEALAGAGFEAPAADPLPAIRAAITTIRAAGYAPDTLILDPATEEALDTLVASAALAITCSARGRPPGRSGACASTSRPRRPRRWLPTPARSAGCTRAR